MPAIATSQYLISIGSVKVHLKLGDSVTEDTWLDQTIASITKRIETFTNRIYKQANYTEFHDSKENKSFVYVFNPPIGTVSVLNVDVNRKFGSSTLFATNTYIQYNKEGKIALLNTSDVINTELNPVVFGKGQQHIKIVYTGGFVAIPEDIKLGALEWIAELNVVRDKKRWGVQNINKRDISTSYNPPDVMPKNVRDLVHPYKLYRVGNRI